MLRYSPQNNLLKGRKLSRNLQKSFDGISFQNRSKGKERHRWGIDAHKLRNEEKDAMRSLEEGIEKAEKQGREGELSLDSFVI